METTCLNGSNMFAHTSTNKIGEAVDSSNSMLRSRSHRECKRYLFGPENLTKKITLADLDADVLYLAMLEVLIRWGIEFDTSVMEVLWVRAARHQFTQNPDVALAFQQRALKWAARSRRSIRGGVLMCL